MPSPSGFEWKATQWMAGLADDFLTTLVENSCCFSGSALGAVVMGSDSPPAWEDPNLRNLVAEVSVCFCSVGSHWNQGCRHTCHEHV